MPQKQVLKAGKKIEKKKEAANRHGKTPVMKKGKFERPPKNAKAFEQYREGKDLSKTINKRNELTAAGQAQVAGGKLKVISAPPVLAPKDKQKRKTAKEQGAEDEAAMEEDE